METEQKHECPAWCGKVMAGGIEPAKCPTCQGPSSNAGPCRRTPDGLELCAAMDMAAIRSDRRGIQVATALNFKTGETTEYVGVRRSAKEKLLLFNVCPFCRFEYAVSTSKVTP